MSEQQIEKKKTMKQNEKKINGRICTCRSRKRISFYQRSDLTRSHHLPSKQRKSVSEHRSSRV
jgi:hypothetical protein